MKYIFKYNSWRKWAAVITLFVSPAAAFAAGPPKPSDVSNPLAQALLVVIVGLLLAIVLLANVVIGAAKLSLQRFWDEKKTQAAKVAGIFLFVLMSSTLFAAENTATADAAKQAVDTSIGGLSATSFYTLMSVIFLEVIILLALVYNLKVLLRKEMVQVSAEEEVVVAKENVWKIWWSKMNSFRPVKEEAQIDLGHDYDGIRELDNRLPPWWLYGFYVCIIFAGVYLWRYHVAHSAPLSAEELKISLEKAEAEKQEYLKNAANNVDENTVKLLTSAADLDAGKKVFTTICAACHRADGGGMVGPNLTDDYWLHGGSISDVFKSIKYGWPEKGMKSWKDDFSPVQIAQIASYVKSLHGTNPPNPKEPQGTLVEEKAAADSAAKK
ncbi:MAG: c-type cytochrome [Bacteroidota bacterium]|nr:c-type cytochrome [Bacteroidota bacterium]